MTFHSAVTWTMAALVLIISSCSVFPEQEVAIKPEPTLTSTFQHTSLAQIYKTIDGSVENRSGNLLLRDGQQALAERLYLTDVAEKAIDAQYFIWNSDNSGKLLMQRILNAAERGVKVRILIDGFSVGERNDQLSYIDHHPNVEIRVYNPFIARTLLGRFWNFVTDFDRLNQRMHNKAFIVDGTVAITGGRNIGDAYFFYSDEINFNDVDLFSVGPVVGQVSQSFNDYWYSPWAIPITELVKNSYNDEIAQGLDDFLSANLTDFLGHDLITSKYQLYKHFEQLVGRLTWAPTTFVADIPAGEVELEKNEPKAVAVAIGAAVANSTDEVLIESAYLVVNDFGLSFFESVNKEGVRIRALTNSMASNNLLINHASYAMVREQMLDSGLELYELKPQIDACLEAIIDSVSCDPQKKVALHAKSAVFDNKTVYVGSMNFNLRSAFLNTESAVFIDSPELANELSLQILSNMDLIRSWQTIKIGDEVVWMTYRNGEFEVARQEPSTTWLERVEVDVLTKLPGTEFY